MSYNKTKWMPEVVAALTGSGHYPRVWHPDRGFAKNNDGSEWSGDKGCAWPNSFEQACAAAKAKCAELNAPPVPKVSDWFEECTAEEAVCEDPLAPSLDRYFALVFDDENYRRGRLNRIWRGDREELVNHIKERGFRPCRPKAVRP